MLQPSLYGFKYQQQNKLTLARLHGLFKNDLYEGELFHLCTIVKSKSTEELINLFNHVELENTDEHHNYAEAVYSPKTIIQENLEDFFKPTSMSCCFGDGTVRVRDFEYATKEIARHIYLDLDEEILVIKEGRDMYSLPFYSIRNLEEEKVFEAFISIRNSHISIFRLINQPI